MEEDQNNKITTQKSNTDQRKWNNIRTRLKQRALGFWSIDEKKTPRNPQQNKAKIREIKEICDELKQYKKKYNYRTDK